MPLGSKLTPPRGVTILHLIILGKLQTTATLELLMGIWPTLTRMIPWWSPTKVVLIDCISRSRGQKIDFQNATFKNLLDQNYKTKSFHIWYITSSRGPLPKLSNYATGVKIDPPGSHNFTLTFRRKFQTTSALTSKLQGPNICNII